MSSDDKKRRAREIASVIAKAPYDAPLQRELGELVLELIEEPEAPTIKETGWTHEYEGMIATDSEGDEVILVRPRKAFDGDTTCFVLWKNSLGRFIALEDAGEGLRPTGRYASANGVLKNAEEQE